MSAISEEEWRIILTEILEDLDEQQYNKMLICLSEIPKCVKTKSREEMPQAIIERYGVETSIHRINEVMDQIPRKDAKVQDWLRPFVDKLKNKQEKTGKKRKSCEMDSKSEDETPEAGFKKNNIVSDSPSDEEAEADELKSPQPDKKRKIPPWRISIHDLKIFGDLGKKAIAGKVVQKSGPRTYQTKNKKKKFFFYLGVADETSSIKVMVYGKERYQRFQEESFFLFRNVIMEKDLMKVTKKSTISKTTSIDVPENLEMEARMLVPAQIPVCSIAKANIAAEKTSVSVEGTITEIGSVENIELKDKQGIRSKQEFKLEDSTGSIRITLWGDDIMQLRGKSQGDVVRVANVKTSHYYDTVSLNSTTFTRIIKVQSAAVQKITIEIVGIIKASSTQTELDAEIGSTEVQSFVVDSSLLAKVFGVRVDSNFEDRLLGEMPFSADVEIEGNKINNMKPAKEK
ncbi:uncharacterized protein LOC115792598 [Archocentrus centrarchus]|uniref:uncharacterized protein LOC115792598 n=1 Tax=Archocentrus centrarchus TaxID=63155 RepID=UPI0011E9C0E5|nr:uncharacterized protein LOC115792598 [Archocentrus centrarchus]